MDETRIRAWWSYRQGLDGSLTGKSPAEILARTGWARSIAGVGPYLTLFSRGGISRQTADHAVANLEICELPSARGCTYVVPAEDFALALKVGQAFSDSEMKTARKLGVSDVEIDELCNTVKRVLAKEALSPDEIRLATDGAVRSLGDEGKKKGLTTTLPVALGRLQADGAIRRVPINGRLDQQRYKYIAWKPNPLKGVKLSAEEANTELARRFFTWSGPATLAEFQWFSGLGAKASSLAVRPLRLEPVAAASDRMILPEDRKELESFRVPGKPQYVLVSSLDGITHLRRNLASLISADDLKRSVAEGKSEVPLNSLQDLPNHAVMDRGRLVGLWEYDTVTESIAWRSFIKDPAIRDAVELTERFIQHELGDARSFSLDSPKSRVPRINALRAASGRL
jgi:hypothetical protein